MSPAADSSALSGGNARNSRLEQPNDAVSMQTMPSSSQAVEQPTSDRKKDDDSAPKTPEPEQADDSSTLAPPKGKEKENPPKPPLKEEQDSNMAIGAAQDEINSINSGEPDSGPTCTITLLLTTGSRHPYKINSAYLSRRNVTMPEKLENGQPDPFSISIYTLKELILREWRSDWESKPASPSSIRLIHFGKLLDDKEPMKSMYYFNHRPRLRNLTFLRIQLPRGQPKCGAYEHSSPRPR